MTQICVSSSHPCERDECDVKTTIAALRGADDIPRTRDQLKLIKIKIQLIRVGHCSALIGNDYHKMSRDVIGREVRIEHNASKHAPLISTLISWHMPPDKVSWRLSGSHDEGSERAGLCRCMTKVVAVLFVYVGYCTVLILTQSWISKCCCMTCLSWAEVKGSRLYIPTRVHGLAAGLGISYPHPPPPPP
jgi:hypothetical protein